MPTAILVLTLITMGIQVGQNTEIFIAGLKTVHHHSIGVAYRHVLKPVAHASKRIVKPAVNVVLYTGEK